MDALTIHEAAETTGWAARNLPHRGRVGLVEPERSRSGYRLYGPAELQRLRTLRELLDEHEIGLSDLAFALRLRRDGDLRQATDAWLRAGARPRARTPGWTPRPSARPTSPPPTGCASSRRSTSDSSPRSRAAHRPP